MSEEALWTIEFEVGQRWTNGGVVVLETGRLYGGDSQYYYVGKYDYAQPTVAEVRVTHYHGPLATAWGDAAPTFNVVLRGNVSDDRNQIEGTIERQGFPTTRFRMVKKEQLP
jgi:T3SS negative regulator,GrlR